MLATGWEETVIGTVLSEPSTFLEADVLRPSDFTGVRQTIWAEMIILANRGALDLRSVVNSLQGSPDWDRFAEDMGNDPQGYIETLLQKAGTNMPEYVDRVLVAATRKALRYNAALIAAEAENENSSIEDVLDYAEQKIFGLRRNRRTDGMTMQDIYAAFIPRYDSLLKGTFRPLWKPPVQAMSEILQYAENTDFIIVAGRPGDGKSSFMRFDAYDGAVREGHKSVIYNLDNDPMDYARAFLALHTGIDSAKIRDPRLLSNREKELITPAIEKLKDLPIEIVTVPGWSAGEICRHARNKKVKGGIDRIYLDYVQLVHNGISNKNEDVAKTTGALRGLGLELETPVIAGSQLSRDIERRGPNSDPVLADLRDSGALEQDPTIIIFPRNDWKTPSPEAMRAFPENIDPGGRLLPKPVAVPIRFHILKNRNGPIGPTSRVKWTKSIGRYQTLLRINE